MVKRSPKSKMKKLKFEASQEIGLIKNQEKRKEKKIKTLENTSSI